MFVSKITKEDLTNDLVDKLLFQGMDDTGENVNCIIVLGSVKADKYRVPVAVNAYHAGRAEKIMLCGGVVWDFPDGRCTEAEKMRGTALASGVSEQNIILENASQNTVENILYALDELQHHMPLDRVHSVLLVTTAYHMRRSLAITRYLFPNHIRIIPCPANDNNTKRNNWMNTPAGIERAKNEVMNIVRYITNGVIPDFEI